MGVKKGRGRARKLVKTEVLRGFTSQLPNPKAKGAAQMARGPRRSRMGSMKMALMSPRTPSTAIPTMRKGNVSNHTIGYSTSASSASGQHKKNRMIHNKKAAMATSVWRRRSKYCEQRQLRAGLYYILRDSARKGSSTAYSWSRNRLAMDAGTSASSRMWESSISECRTRPSA